MVRLLSGTCFLAVAIAAVAAPARAAPPPIKCAAAHQSVERLICASPESLAMEAEIAALYGRGMATFAADDRHRLALSQRAYLHKRDGCDWASHHSAHPGAAIEECVHAMMDERLRKLRHVVDLGRF